MRKHRKIIQMIIRRMLEKDGTVLEVAAAPPDPREAGAGEPQTADGKRIVLHPSDAVRARFFSEPAQPSPG